MAIGRLGVVMLVASIAASCSQAETAGPDEPECEVLVDDYGFEIEVCGSATTGTADEATAELTDLVLAIPSPDLQEIVGDALRVIGDAAAPCASFAAWAPRMSAAADALDTATAAAVADDSLDTWIGSDEAAGLATAVEQRLIDLPECDDPPSEEDGLALAGTLTSAVDRWRHAIRPGFASGSSAYWWSSDALGHSLMVQDVLADEGRIDVVVIGDSAVKLGFDPIALGDGLEQVAVGLGINGMVIGQYATWLDELDGLGAEPGLVVLQVAPYQSLYACGDLRPALQQGARERRGDAFARVAGLADIDPSRRVSGGTSGTYDSLLLDTYADFFAPGGRGLADPSRDAITEAEFDNMVDVYTAIYGNPPCTDWADALDTTLTQIEAAGATAVVVDMPVSSELDAIHQNSTNAQEDLTAPFALVADAHGVDFLDFSDLLGDDDFRDVVHPNPAGRAQLTAALLTALSPTN
ncbi:MAG: SGNH/GDSL hydrolase family protein [Acidimicrobiales bacterium]